MWRDIFGLDDLPRCLGCHIDRVVQLQGSARDVNDITNSSICIVESCCKAHVCMEPMIQVIYFMQVWKHCVHGSCVSGVVWSLKALAPTSARHVPEGHVLKNALLEQTGVEQTGVPKEKARVVRKVRRHRGTNKIYRCHIDQQTGHIVQLAFSTARSRRSRRGFGRTVV